MVILMDKNISFGKLMNIKNSPSKIRINDGSINVHRVNSPFVLPEYNEDNYDDIILFSSSESSTASFNFEPNMKANLESDDEMSSSETSITNMQIQFLLQVSTDIDTKYFGSIKNLKKNQVFWSFLWNQFGMSDLFTKLDSIDDKNFKNQIDFIKNLNKFLICLNKIETKFQINNDDDLLVKLSFLVYTEVIQLMKLNNLYNPSLIFELELIDSNSAFEKALNTFLNQFTEQESLFNLMGNQNCFQQELCDESDFSEWIKNNNQCKLCEKKFVDIGQLMSKPTITCDTENYLTQNLKFYANNLSKLNLFTYDPYTEANEDAELGYGQSDVLSFACLLFSYYSMGCFEIKKFLFENNLQFLYESKYFYDEFNTMFRNDLILSDTKKCLNKQCTDCSSLKKSKWNFMEITQTKTTDINKSEKNQNLSIIDEILNRISNLDAQNFFNSYFTLINNEDVENDLICKERLLQRSWTVAPKLFSTNTINNLNSGCFHHSTLDGTTLEPNPGTNEQKQNWFKNEMKPIGSKPASMYTTSLHYQNQRRPDKSVQSSNFNHKNVKNWESIWSSEKNENDFKRLFMFCEVSNNNEDVATQPKLNPVVTINRVNINSNQSKSEIKVTGKYSVAPLNINQKRKNKTLNDYDFYRSNNFKDDFKEITQEFTGFKSFNNLNSNQFKYPIQKYGGHTVNGGYEQQKYEEMNYYRKPYQSYNLNNFKRMNDSIENNRYQQFNFNKNRIYNRQK